MLFWKNKKKEEHPYMPAFSEVESQALPDENTPPEEEAINVPNEMRQNENEEAPADTETVTLEDGRVFLRTFVEEIRAYDAPDLKVIIEEQREYYSEDEFTYICEVFRERLGDIH